MALNVELLRKVRDRIAATPEEFNMDWFVNREDDCGTTACIAGHAAVMRHRNCASLSELSDADVVAADCYTADSAREALGLTAVEAHVLFYDWHWPRKFRFRAELDEDVDQNIQAKAAVKFIDHILELGYVPTVHL